MPSVHLSTGTVHYIEQGDGDPLVLLHANPGDSRDFEAVIPELAREHRVLAPDWPGYGRSEPLSRPASGTVRTLGGVLREFLTALSLPSASFIGHSVGGNVALRLACDTPIMVRRLVLVAPGGFTPHNALTRAFCRLQGSRLSIPPRHFATLYLRRRTPTTEAMLNRAATGQATPDALALNRALWRDFGRPDTDLREDARGVRAPTLLLFGSRDLVIPAGRDGRVARRCIPSAEFVVLPCGHAPFAELPERFLALVRPFLAAPEG